MHRWQGVLLADLLRGCRSPGRRRGRCVVGSRSTGSPPGSPWRSPCDGRAVPPRHRYERRAASGGSRLPGPARHPRPVRLRVGHQVAERDPPDNLGRLRRLLGSNRGWSKEGPIKTESRIDVPRGGASLTAGANAIAGVAWAPTRGIDKVEVQVDDGDWQEARLGDEDNRTTAGASGSSSGTPPRGDHEIRVRATDGTGATQTDEIAPPRPSGATGWHTISASRSSDPASRHSGPHSGRHSGLQSGTCTRLVARPAAFAAYRAASASLSASSSPCLVASAIPALNVSWVRRVHALAGSVDQVLCVPRRRLRQQQQELLAAVAEGEVGRAHGAADEGPEVREHQVAGLVPVLVVELLEVVEVEQHQAVAGQLRGQRPSGGRSGCSGR